MEPTPAQALAICRTMQVSAGEPLVVIETEKVQVEMDAPATGTLVETVGRVSGVYPIGEVIAVIDVPAGG
jgi:pyruvate/2-oxoglutarate dehydrogenase complex dihydrolipoamide acyltransferase (E2) component